MSLPKPTIMFSSELAERLGITKAIVLAQIEALMESKGHWAKHDLVKLLPFYKVSELKDAVSQLKQDQILIESEINYSNPLLADAELEAALDNWAFGAEVGLPVQPSLIPVAKRRPVPRGPDPVSPTHIRTLARICYGTETDEAYKLLPAGAKGRLAETAAQLLEAKADLGKLNVFEEWWDKNWRSHDRKTGQYVLPSPIHIVTHWWEAMKSGVKPKKEEEPEVDVSRVHGDIYAVMRARAEKQNRDRRNR